MSPCRHVALVAFFQPPTSFENAPFLHALLHAAPPEHNKRNTSGLQAITFAVANQLLRFTCTLPVMNNYAIPQWLSHEWTNARIRLALAQCG